MSDGLADFADGSNGKRISKDKKLKAMKDLSTGSAGVLLQLYCTLLV